MVSTTPCGQPPSIYTQTAATIIKLLTSRLGAGRAEVQWEEEDYSDNEDEDDPPENGSATGLVGGNTDYAPRGPPKVNKGFAGIVAPPLRTRISRKSPIGKLCSTCAVCNTHSDLLLVVVLLTWDLSSVLSGPSHQKQRMRVSSNTSDTRW